MLSFTPMQLRIFSITARKEMLSALPSGVTAVKLTDWELTLSDGSTVDAGDVLGDWRRWEDPCYSGILTYRTEFHLDKDCRIRLDLGKVCYAPESVWTALNIWYLLLHLPRFLSLPQAATAWRWMCSIQAPTI